MRLLFLLYSLVVVVVFAPLFTEFCHLYGAHWTDRCVGLVQVIDLHNICEFYIDFFPSMQKFSKFIHILKSKFNMNNIHCIHIFGSFYNKQKIQRVEKKTNFVYHRDDTHAGEMNSLKFKYSQF